MDIHGIRGELSGYVFGELLQLNLLVCVTSPTRKRGRGRRITRAFPLLRVGLMSMTAARKKIRATLR